ncbi:MAG: hypothetical protein ABH878_07595 [bacterium]
MRKLVLLFEQIHQLFRILRRQLTDGVAADVGSGSAIKRACSMTLKNNG